MPGQEIPKVLYRLNGKPIVKYLVETFKEVRIERPVIVVGYREELVRKALGGGVDYVIQKEQMGTGHAVMATEKKLEDQKGSVLIAYGDMPLWSSQTIEKLWAKKEKSGATLVLATVKLPEAFDFGRIIRDKEGKIKANVEAKDCTPEQLKIEEKNPSLYLADIKWLFSTLKKIRPNNRQGEYYLTDIIELAVKEEEPIETVEVEEKKEAMGVNTDQDYQAIQKEI